MEQNLILRSKDNHGESSLAARFKRLFRGQEKRTPKPKPSRRFGKTVGIVWEYQYSNNSEPIACIVQIKRGQDAARVAIYDSNDPHSGTSLTNVFEEVATGVYLEHLADDYTPSQVAFSHRNTLPFGSEPQWGTTPVSLTWNAGDRRFEDPNWNGWKPDFEIPETEKILVRELRSVAAVAIETWMRHRHERGEVTPRERELYDRYQEHISIKSESYRYNLRGGWIFAPPRSYL